MWDKGRPLGYSPGSMSLPDEEPPNEVAGKYRLVRLLGRGGMGSVWEGVHESLGTKVAVKFIESEYATSDDLRRRFVNEAKAAAKLRSKHVVQVYDQGVGEDGRPFIVMEFLSGEPLDQRLGRLGRLAPKETARIALHVCRALAKAHEVGIVHRDLKPENIFLVRDEEDDTDIAKVVDFGIAKFTETSDPTSSTRTGAVLGTPQYMSPEQARGLKTVDSRTDLWSLGVIVYLCMTGTMPFKGEAVGDLLVNICTMDPAPPSTLSGNLPVGFDTWIKKALAREPTDRFQDAAAFCDSLAELCGSDARLGAGTTSAREWAGPPARAATPAAATGAGLSTTYGGSSGARRKTPWVALGAVFGVVAIGAFFVARSALRDGAAVGPDPEAARAGVSAVPSAAAPELAPSTEPAIAPAVAVTQPVPAPSAAPTTQVAAPEAHKAIAPAPRVAQTPKAAAPAPAPRPSPSKPPEKKDELGY